MSGRICQAPQAAREDLVLLQNEEGALHEAVALASRDQLGDTEMLLVLQRLQGPAEHCRCARLAPVG